MVADIEVVTPDDELFVTYTLQLYEALVSGKGLASLLDTAKTIFGNPILIADTSFKVLGHIERPDMNDALWQQIIEKGYYPSHYIKALTDSNELYDHVYSNGKPIVLTDAGSPNRYLSKMIKVNGKPVGFSACIEYERPITELDIRLFDVFCKVIGTELRTDDAISQHHAHGYEFFISEMLSGPVNSDFLEERIKQVGIKLKSNIFVLVAKFRDEKMRREYQMEYFRTMLEQIVPLGYCVVYRNSLVLLISQEHRMPLPDTIKEKVSKMLDSSGMVGGISYRFQTIESLNIHYEQACEAIRYGNRFSKTECLFDYGDVYYFHMLDIVRQTADLKKFCNPKLYDVIEYDNEYGTNYTMTAYEYLNANAIPILAAKRMDIHRNTIDYRIKRLEELFGIDFSNNETVFSFALSFRIIRFLAEPPFNTEKA